MPLYECILLCYTKAVITVSLSLVCAEGTIFNQTPQYNAPIRKFSDGSVAISYMNTGRTYSWKRVKPDGTVAYTAPHNWGAAGSAGLNIHIDQFDNLWILAPYVSGSTWVLLIGRYAPNADLSSFTLKNTSTSWTSGTYSFLTNEGLIGVVYDNPANPASDVCVLISMLKNVSSVYYPTVTRMKFNGAAGTWSPLPELVHSSFVATNGSASTPYPSATIDDENNIHTVLHFSPASGSGYSTKRYYWPYTGSFTWGTCQITDIWPNVASGGANTSGGEGYFFTQGPNQGKVAFSAIMSSSQVAKSFITSKDGTVTQASPIYRVGSVGPGIMSPCLSGDQTLFYAATPWNALSSGDIWIDIYNHNLVPILQRQYQKIAGTDWTYNCLDVSVCPGSDNKHVHIFFIGLNTSTSQVRGYVYFDFDLSPLDTQKLTGPEVLDVPSGTYPPSAAYLTNGDMLVVTAARSSYMTPTATGVFELHLIDVTTGQKKVLANSALPSIPANLQGRPYISIDEGDLIHVAINNHPFDTPGNVNGYNDSFYYWCGTIDASHNTVTWRVSAQLLKTTSLQFDYAWSRSKTQRAPRLLSHKLPNGDSICHIVLAICNPTASNTATINHLVIKVSPTYVCTVTDTVAKSISITDGSYLYHSFTALNHTTYQIRAAITQSNAAGTYEIVGTYNSGTQTWSWGTTTYPVSTTWFSGVHNGTTWDNTGALAWEINKNYAFAGSSPGSITSTASHTTPPNILSGQGSVMPCFDSSGNLYIAWFANITTSSVGTNTPANTVYFGKTDSANKLVFSMWKDQKVVPLDQSDYLIMGPRTYSNKLPMVLGKMRAHNVFVDAFYGAQPYAIIKSALNNPPGTPTLTSPVASGIYTDTVELTASCVDPDGDTVSLIWDYSTNGTTWTNITTIGTVASGSIQTYNWDVSGLPAGDYQVRVRAIDINSDVSSYVTVNPISVGHVMTSSADVSFGCTVNDVDVQVTRIATTNAMAMTASLSVTTTQTILKGTGSVATSGTISTPAAKLIAAGAGSVAGTLTVTGSCQVTRTTGGSASVTGLLSNTKVLLTLGAKASVAFAGTVTSPNTQVTHPGTSTVSFTGTLSNSGTIVVHEGYADVLQALVLLNNTPAAIYKGGATASGVLTATANAVQTHKGQGVALGMTLIAASDHVLQSLLVEEGVTNKTSTEGGGASVDWSKWSHWSVSGNTYWYGMSQYDDPQMGKVFQGTAKDTSYIFDYYPYSWALGEVLNLGIWLKADRVIPNKSLNFYLTSIAGGTQHSVGSVNVTVTLTTEWQFVPATITATEACAAQGGIGVNLRTGNDGIVYSAARPQFVTKGIATSFDDDTRASEVLRIPTSNLTVSQGTIGLWITPNVIFDWNNYLHFTYGSNRFLLFMSATGNVYWDFGVANSTITAPAGTAKAGQPIHIALRWGKNPGDRELFVNGKYIGTGTFITPDNLPSTISVATNGSTEIHAVWTSSNSLSDADITASYEAGPFWIAPAYVTNYIFDGALPAGTSLTRASNAINPETGETVTNNVPRFVEGMTIYTRVTHPGTANVNMSASLTGGSVIVGAGRVDMDGVFMTSALPVATYIGKPDDVPGVLTITAQELVHKLAGASVTVAGSIIANNSVLRLASSNPLNVSGITSATGVLAVVGNSSVDTTLSVVNTELILTHTSKSSVTTQLTLNTPAAVGIFKGSTPTSVSSMVTTGQAKVQYAGESTVGGSFVAECLNTQVMIKGRGDTEFGLNIENTALKITWAGLANVVGSNMVTAAAAIAAKGTGSSTIAGDLTADAAIVAKGTTSAAAVADITASTIGAVHRLNSGLLYTELVTQSVAVSTLAGESSIFASLITVVEGLATRLANGTLTGALAVSTVNVSAILAGGSNVSTALNVSANQTVLRLNSATVAGEASVTSNAAATLVGNSSITTTFNAEAGALVIRPSDASVEVGASSAGSGIVIVDGQGDTLITTAIIASSYPIIIAAGTASAGGFASLQGIAQTVISGNAAVEALLEIVGRSTYTFLCNGYVDITSGLDGDPWRIDAGAQASATVIASLTGNWERIRHAVGASDNQASITAFGELAAAGATAVQIIVDAQASTMGSLITPSQGSSYFYLDVIAQGMSISAGYSDVFGEGLVSVHGTSIYSGGGTSDIIGSIQAVAAYVSGSESDVSVLGTLIAQASILYDGEGLLEAALDILAEALRMPLGEVSVLIDSDTIAIAEVIVPPLGQKLTLIVQPEQTFAVQATGDRVLTLDAVTTRTLNLKVFVKEE